MSNNVTFDEMNELLDEIYRSGGETWVEIDGQTYYTDWGYGVVAIEFFIRMLKNRKSDNDATQARQDVVADVDEIIEHVINANMLSMPYDVYSALFDAVDGLGVEIENLQADNAKLRELVSDMQPFWHRMADEEPSDEKGRYLLIVKIGAMRLANGFHVWEHSKSKSFYILNDRSGYVDFDKVKAWAVVPEMEVDA